MNEPENAHASQFDHHRNALKEEIDQLAEKGVDCNSSEATTYIFFPQAAIKELFLRGVHVRKRLQGMWSCSHNVQARPDLPTFRSRIQSAEDQKSASIIFAILVYIGIQVDSMAWQYFMRELESGTLYDAQLPFGPRSEAAAPLEGPFQGAFGREQYKFCPIVLGRSEQGLLKLWNYQSSRLLPYVQESLIGEGSAGKVYKVKIAKGCCQWATWEQENPCVYWARKDMELSDSRPELKMAVELLKGDILHRYLVKTLGGLVTAHRVSLFFDRANSDLEMHMEREDPRVPTEELENMIGIAGALEYLHSGIRVGANTHYCYHLDIKPQNILVFDGDVKFKLADFSISKIKRKNGGLENVLNHYIRSPVSRTVINDACVCVAPEATGENPRFEKECDIWSYGCTLCLVLIWTFTGKEGLMKFRRKLSDPSFGASTGQFFSECRPSTPVKRQSSSSGSRTTQLWQLHPQLEVWFDSELPKNGCELYLAIWEYIRDHLMRIDHSKRDNASELAQKLPKILYGQADGIYPTKSRKASSAKSHTGLAGRVLTGLSGRTKTNDVTKSRHRWKLNVSPSSVQKCASSPDKRYLAFLHREVVEIFDISRDQRYRTDPIKRIYIEKFCDGSTAHWNDCCFNENYLFLVPKVVELSGRNGKFRLIAFPLMYRNRDIFDQTDAIWIQGSSDRRVERVAAAPHDNTLLACVVLDKDTKALPGDAKPALIWDVMLLQLHGLAHCSQFGANSAAWSETMAEIRREVAVEIANILILPTYLPPESFPNRNDPDNDKPITYPGVESLKLEFAPSGTRLILASKSRSHDIYLFWWDLEDGATGHYFGSSTFQNTGERDEGNKSFNGSCIAKDGSVFIIRFNKQLHILTPVSNVNEPHAGQFTNSVTKAPRNEVHLVAVSADESCAYVVGKSKRARVGIFYLPVTPDMQFGKREAWEVCATSQELEADPFRDNPACAPLYRPFEWDDDNKTHAMLLINYEGSAEVLYLSHPSTRRP